MFSVCFRRVQYDTRLGIVTETPRISPDYYNFEQRRWTFTAVSRRNPPLAIWYPIFYGPREYAAAVRLDEQSARIGQLFQRRNIREYTRYNRPESKTSLAIFNSRHQHFKSYVNATDINWLCSECDIWDSRIYYLNDKSRVMHISICNIIFICNIKFWIYPWIIYYKYYLRFKDF